MIVLLASASDARRSPAWARGRTTSGRSTPARTGARSRAVDDRDRSSSSSDHGSAIEGFRQEISLHDELTNLGGKPRQFRIAVLLTSAVLVVKYQSELLHRLAFPRRNLGRMQAVSCRQLRHRLVTFDRLQRHLGLELSRKSSPRP